MTINVIWTAVKCSYWAKCAYTGHEFTGYCFIANDNLVWQYRVKSISSYTGVISLILLWHSNVKPQKSYAFLWVPWNLLYKEQCFTGIYVMCVIAHNERSVGCASLRPLIPNPFVWWFWLIEFYSLHLIKGLTTWTYSIPLCYISAFGLKIIVKNSI